MPGDQGFSDLMDQESVYEWGLLFASPWDELVKGMRSRAEQVGMVQEDGDHCLTWKKSGVIQIRFLFVNDPSVINTIRGIFNDELNAESPVCFIIVQQEDPFERRGDTVFDIFRMSPKSYLWHFYRVYKPPGGS